MGLVPNRDSPNMHIELYESPALLAQRTGWIIAVDSACEDVAPGSCVFFEAGKYSPLRSGGKEYLIIHGDQLLGEFVQ